MLNKIEFINTMIGKPWRFRASSFNAVDCWGLVVLYYRNVLGIELHQVKGVEKEKEFLTVYDENIIKWDKLNWREESCIFVAYSGLNPVHVGIVVDGKALHASESSGCVRCDSIPILERYYSRLEFLKYANH